MNDREDSLGEAGALDSRADLQDVQVNAEVSPESVADEAEVKGAMGGVEAVADPDPAAESVVEPVAEVEESVARSANEAVVDASPMDTAKPERSGDRSAAAS